MGPCDLHYFGMRECDCDYPHCYAHLVHLPSQETCRARHEPPNRNRLGFNRDSNRERHGLSGRAACLPHPLCPPATCPGHYLQDCCADLRAYPSTDGKFVRKLNIPLTITQGIAPTLIFIRMSGLLDTPSALTLSGATPSSRPISTRLDLSRSMTASTGPGMFTSTERRNYEARWKPSGVDLESNFSPKFSSAENSTVV